MAEYNSDTDNNINDTEVKVLISKCQKTSLLQIVKQIIYKWDDVYLNNRDYDDISSYVFTESSSKILLAKTRSTRFIRALVANVSKGENKENLVDIDWVKNQFLKQKGVSTFS